MPIPHRKKAPGHAGWQNRTLESARATLDADWPAGVDMNVGVLLGQPSDWLVDVDLDHERAIELAPAFLPPTLTFGRASKPASHWLYKCPGAATSKRDKVEVRSTGAQTVFPGSVHESGETIDWGLRPPTQSVVGAVAPNQESDEPPPTPRMGARAPTPAPCDPSPVTWDVLSAAVDRLRAACAVSDAVPGEGERHDFFLKLSGALAHLGWPEEDASSFVRAVCAATGCDPEHHARGLADTFQRKRDGVQVSGIPKLLEAGVSPKAMGSLRKCSPQGDDRDSILWRPESAEAVADAVCEALAKDAQTFQRGGRLTSPVQGALLALTRATLHGRIDSCCRIVRRTAKGDVVSCFPPAELVALVHERGHWPGVRAINAVSNHPILRADGTVATEPGYDEATGTWLQDCPKLSVPLIAPTLHDAQLAVAELGDVVGEFPFDGEAGMGLSVWLALVLTMLARPAIDGSVPAFVFDASASRSGKSLLVKTAGLLVHGRLPPTTSAPKGDQDEWDKLLRTVALEGWPLLFLDNVTGRLKSAALEAFVTSGGAVRGRVLGESRSTDTDKCPTVVAVTSNNATLGPDMVGRSLHCRLDPGVEAPGLRSGWRHHPLEVWVLSQRPRLLGAACTLLRAHAVAGRPGEGASLGGFESWSAIVGSALAWVGLPDPVASQAELKSNADEETDALGAVLTAWRAQFGDKPMTAAQALRDAQPELRGALAEWSETDYLTAVKLGQAVHRVRSRIAAGLKFVLAGKRDGTALWRVAQGGCRG